ncbi:hypothetical protein RFI_05692 [Reticulomyxa filosa]|uniref:C2 domain-containing protein n=1 Tax=Reticulomyxa filosa TaxID=46433 RepID=X6NZP8_RETFI|nr:hypothetical protein RFI_05692 [Reticulomyxa filosa]|eukprot:ETO31426.1 hypothetical protein RFI_05692 [Reticulomyxa filosa]
MTQAPVKQLDPDSLKEQVQMFLSVQDLVSKDLLSKSDPFVVVYMKTQRTGRFEEVGRTETVKDSHYPKFAKEFLLDYFFEEEQELRFDVYDEDKSSKNLKDHDFLGSCHMVVGELVHAPGQQLVKQLLLKGKTIKNGKTKMYARLTARVELLGKGTQEDLTFTFAGEKLAKMDFFGKSDPFLEIYRYTKEQTTLVHKTEVIKNTDKPTWKPFSISSQKLCNSDPERPLLLRVWDWDSDGSQQLIGEVKTNLNFLRNNFKAELENPQKKGKKVGTLKVVDLKSTVAYSFLHYMAGGVDMSLMVAIDFTGSNGHPLNPQSLHHLTPQGSQYQQAIRTIGNIVSCYDSDQKFPVWGFGAKMPDGTVSHDFALNGKEDDAEVSGIHGIEEVYVQAIRKVELYGPTLFQSILQKAIAIADSAHDNVKQKLQYFTLLILTDGVINDFKETKDLFSVLSFKQRKKYIYKQTVLSKAKPFFWCRVLGS